MKTLGYVLIAVGVLVILLGILGVGGLTNMGILFGFVLLAGGWVLFRTNKKKELATRH